MYRIFGRQMDDQALFVKFPHKVIDIEHILSQFSGFSMPVALYFLFFGRYGRIINLCSMIFFSDGNLMNIRKKPDRPVFKVDPADS